jgi:hypothetical protein
MLGDLLLLTNWLFKGVFCPIHRALSELSHSENLIVIFDLKEKLRQCELGDRSQLAGTIVRTGLTISRINTIQLDASALAAVGLSGNFRD